MIDASSPLLCRMQQAENESAHWEGGFVIIGLCWFCSCPNHFLPQINNTQREKDTGSVDK